VPATSIDTFFACTIILAVAVLTTGFMASTMQARINGTEEINKQAYLNAIADKIINQPGSPSDWGSTSSVPNDFGLAVNTSSIPYEIDINKINRLSNASLSIADLQRSAQLYNLALRITVSQILTVQIKQLSNNTVNNMTTFRFSVSTTINSKPIDAMLRAYPISKSSLGSITNSTSDSGTCILLVQIPEEETTNAILAVYARTSFDQRLTSFAIYDFNASSQRLAPENNIVTLSSPVNDQIIWTSNSTSIRVESGNVYSFEYIKTLNIIQGVNQYTLPLSIEPSPKVIIIRGHINGTYFQEWVSNPNLLIVGSDFTSIEQNIFSYLVTIERNLYRVEISLGDIAS
jgi:hypothetical protein